MIKSLAITYRVSLELLFGILVLFFFYIKRDILPPILLVSLISLVSTLLFSFFLIKWNEKGKWLYIFIILPLLFLIGLHFGLSKFGLVVISFIIFWRSMVIYIEGTGQSESLIILLTLFAGVIALIYSSISQYPFRGTIVFLMLIQILLVLVVNFYRKWSTVKGDKAGYAVFFSKVLASVTFIGILISLFVKPLQYIFFSFLKGAALLVAFMMIPLLNLLQRFHFGEQKQKGNAASMDGFEEFSDESKNQSFIVTEDLIFIGMFLLVLSFIIYLVWKRKFHFLGVEEKNAQAIVFIEEKTVAKRSLFRNRQMSPEDAVRREFYELERYAKKFHCGREKSETVEEWLQRIDFPEIESVVQIYEKVRYGERQSSDKEKIFVRDKLVKLKKLIKDRNKKGKNLTNL
nr:hypothetical protein [Neobacillus sp. Marseille-Q6967]